MAKDKFMKVKFLQSTELAGVGYSSVGGPARDGVYHAVPASVLAASEYAENMAKAGLLEILGDGQSPETAGDRVQPEELAAFKDSGMSEEQWLAKQPVDRGALVGLYNEKVAKDAREKGEAAVAAAGKSNSANASKRELTAEEIAAKETADAAAKKAKEEKDAAAKVKKEEAAAKKTAPKKSGK